MAKPVNIVTELPAGTTSQGYQLATRVDVLENGIAIATVDEVTGGSVTMDANAESRSSLDVSIVDDGTLGWNPESPDSPLAPYGNELQAFRGIEFYDRIELVSLGIFQIQRCSSSDSAEGINISVTGPDRSGKIIDAAFEDAGQIAAGTNVITAITTILQGGWPSITLDLAASAVTLPLLSYSEGENRWAFAQGLAISIGGELYFDKLGICRLRPVPVASSGSPVAYVQEGEGGALLSADREWDRAKVYNRTIVTGENPANTSTPPRATATDTNFYSPTYYNGANSSGREFGKKPKFYSNQYITNTTQAQDAANGLLSRVIGAPDSISFDALVDPARAPSEVVRVTRERLGIDEDHILDTLTIPLDVQGTMGGNTRVAQEFS